jgi:hypothetical protein
MAQREALRFDRHLVIIIIIGQRKRRNSNPEAFPRNLTDPRATSVVGDGFEPSVGRPQQRRQPLRLTRRTRAIMRGCSVMGAAAG